MPKDDLRKIIEAQRVLSTQLAPFANRLKLVAESQQMTRFAHDINRLQELMRPAFGPINDLRSLAGDLSLALESNEDFRRIQDLALVAEKRFYRPETRLAMNLVRQFENGALGSMIERYQLSMPQLQLAMDAMTTSWLDTTNKKQSIAGFVALQGIGHLLRSMQPFDDRLTETIKIDLGDWSRKIVCPPAILIDAPARTSFYVERGLNPNLTAFPSDAFEQIVLDTGLRPSKPSVANTNHFGSEKDEVEIEFAFERTNRAHDSLQRFERLIRKFIDERMQEAFGPRWVKRQVPGEMRQQWIEKQQRARDNGEPDWPLMDYADFTDYIKIITRNDNWREVFERFFVRKSSIQESFQRLYPIRTCAMHARLITQDDELYLFVETTRILVALRVAP